MNQKAYENKMMKQQYCVALVFDNNSAIVVKVEVLNQDDLFLNNLQNIRLLKSWVKDFFSGIDCYLYSSIFYVLYY